MLMKTALSTWEARCHALFVNMSLWQAVFVVAEEQRKGANFCGTVFLFGDDGFRFPYSLLRLYIFVVLAIHMFTTAFAEIKSHLQMKIYTRVFNIGTLERIVFMQVAIQKEQKIQGGFVVYLTCSMFLAIGFLGLHSWAIKWRLNVPAANCSRGPMLLIARPMESCTNMAEIGAVIYSVHLRVFIDDTSAPFVVESISVYLAIRIQPSRLVFS